MAVAAVWNYLLVLANVSLSQYETNFYFAYSVDSSLPPSTGAYYAARISEAMNFSSITTGVTKDFHLRSTFSSRDDAPLSLVHANAEMAAPDGPRFVAFQRDFFDAQLAGDAARYRRCDAYFADCGALALKAFNSTLTQASEAKEDYFFVDARLQAARPAAGLNLRFGTEASVTLLHFKLRSSIYYLVLAGIFLHAVVLLYNVVTLTRKRNELQAVITRLKAQ